MAVSTDISPEVQKLQYKLYKSKFLDQQAYKQLVSNEFKKPFPEEALQQIYEHVWEIVKEEDKVYTYFDIFGNTMHMATSMRVRFIRTVVGIR